MSDRMVGTTPPPGGGLRLGGIWLFVVAGLAAFAAGVGVQFIRGGDDEARGDHGPFGSTDPTVCVLEDDAVLASFGSPLTIREDTYTQVPCAIGELVKKGTTVKAEPGAEALFFGENGPVKIAWNGHRRVEGLEEAAPELEAFWPRLISLHAEKQARFAEILNTGALGGVPNELRIEGPVGKVLVAQPRIVWHDRTDSYPYRLRARKGNEILWETVVHERFKGAMIGGFPAERPLERGDPCVLEIVSSDGRTAGVPVELVSEEEERRVKRPMEFAAQLLGDLVAYHFLAANWYWNAGFTHQAALELSVLAQQRLTDRFPLEALVTLHFDAGNPELALDLAKKLEKMPVFARVTVRPTEPGTPPARD